MPKKKEEAQVTLTPEDIITINLSDTGREGIDDLVAYMHDNGFFTAPCSGGNHLCREGGLAEHSINVLRNAQKFARGIYGEELTKEMEDSITIAALLHDLGKMGDHGQQLYVPNMLKSGKQSDAKPYERNKELPLYQEHAVMSVVIANRWIDLTPLEEHAIRYHDGMYERYNCNYAGSETWLSMIIHMADLWASKISEV